MRVWLRRACQATLVTTLVLLAGCAVWGSVTCSPVGRALDAEFVAVCIEQGLSRGLLNGAVALASDVVIFVLPLPVIAKLQLPLRRKVGLGLVFFTGFL